MMGVFVSMSSVGGQWRRSTALFAHHSPDSQNEKHWGCSAVASFSRTLRVQGDVLGDIVMIKLGGQTTVPLPLEHAIHAYFLDGVQL